MFTFLIGVAVGAAFAPFWIKAWNTVSTWVKDKLAK